MTSRADGVKLTKAQRELLADAARSGGRVMFDGIEARVATNLAKKGLVTLPAWHGFYFGNHLLTVRATDAGRRALNNNTDGTADA